MKPRPIHLPVAIITMALTACTEQRSISVQHPAEVTIPAQARRVLLMDRTKPRSGFSNTIESWTSRESGMDDGLGREMNLLLQEALGEAGRFDVIVDHARHEGSGTGTLPDPLSWDSIVQLCAHNDADILIALEALDTDVNIDQRERVVQESLHGKPVGKPYTEFLAFRRITLKYGWRVYDRRGRVILDMFTDRSTHRDDSQGYDKLSAKNNLTDKRDVVQRLADGAAWAYAKRFEPTTSIVTRRLHTGGDPRLRKAAALNIRGDLPGAMRIWESMLADGNAKLRAKACYNLAVAHEIRGELALARDHALRATDECGHRSGRIYAAQLEQRMKEEVQARLESELMDQLR